MFNKLIKKLYILKNTLYEQFFLNSYILILINSLFFYRIKKKLYILKNIL